MHFYKKTIIAMLVSSCLGGVAAAQDDFSISITGPAESQPAKRVVNRDNNTTRQVAPAQNVNAQRNREAPAVRTAAPAPTPVANTQKAAPNNTARNVAATTAAAATTAIASNAIADSNKTPKLLGNDPEENTPTKEYKVQKQDTIWSIASKFLPPNSRVNEFQAVASIYRHNPDAFANGNVNNLRLTEIKVPSAEMMALENPKTGSELLKKGSIQLPPLSAANTKTATGGALPDNVINMFDSQLAKANKDGKANDKAVLDALKNINNNLGTQSAATEQPGYVAHETAVKNNMVNSDGINQFASNLGDVAKSASENNNAPKANANESKSPSKTTVDTTKLLDNVDINKLLDNTKNKQVGGNNSSISSDDIDSLALQELIKKSQVDTKRQYNVLSKKIDEGVLRSEVVAKSAAANVAKDEVIKALADYEQIITQLQQANIELRATLSRMTKQIDNVRALGLQNQDGLADVHQLLSSYSNVGKSDKAPEGPMMWILLGVGLLSLILAAAFMILRMKTKSANKEAQNAMQNMDDDDNQHMEDEVLLSSTVSKPSIADLNEDAMLKGSSGVDAALEKEMNDEKKKQMN